MTIDVTTDIELLIQQDREGNLKEFLSAVLAGVQAEIVEAALQYEVAANIDTAGGVNLDTIGLRFELPRPNIRDTPVDRFKFSETGVGGVGFDQAPFWVSGVDTFSLADDDLYRSLLKVKGLQLWTNGSSPSLHGPVRAFFPDSNVFDFQDMSMSVRVNMADIDWVLIDNVLNRYGVTLTKPCGVRLREIQFHHLTGAFGFEGNGVSFDQAPFIKVARAGPTGQYGALPDSLLPDSDGAGGAIPDNKEYAIDYFGFFGNGEPFNVEPFTQYPLNGTPGTNLAIPDDEDYPGQFFGFAEAHAGFDATPFTRNPLDGVPGVNAAIPDNVDYSGKFWFGFAPSNANFDQLPFTRRPINGRPGVNEAIPDNADYSILFKFGFAPRDTGFDQAPFTRA